MWIKSRWLAALSRGSAAVDRPAVMVCLDQVALSEWGIKVTCTEDVGRARRAVLDHNATAVNSPGKSNNHPCQSRTLPGRWTKNPRRKRRRQSRTNRDNTSIPVCSVVQHVAYCCSCPWLLLAGARANPARNSRNAACTNDLQATVYGGRGGTMYNTAGRARRGVVCSKCQTCQIKCTVVSG